MIRIREFQIIAFAVRRGRVFFSTFYRAVKELLTYRRGVCVPFTDIHRIAGVVNKLPGNEYYLNRLIAYSSVFTDSDS
jgi:hypothetical protein